MLAIVTPGRQCGAPGGLAVRPPGASGSAPKANRLRFRVVAVSIFAHIVLLTALFHFVPELAPVKIQPVLRYFELGLPQAARTKAGKRAAARPVVPAISSAAPVAEPLTEPAPAVESSQQSDETGEVAGAGAIAGSPELAGGETSDTMLVSRPVPRNAIQLVHPARALEYGIEGKAAVWFIIDEKGSVTRAGVLSEAPRGYGFGAEAIRAIRRSSFEPALRAGRPVASRATQEIVFVLD